VAFFIKTGTIFTLKKWGKTALYNEETQKENTMKLFAKLSAKRDSKKFMKQFSNRKVEPRFRKVIVNILAHKNGPEWRSIAKSQARQLDEMRELLNTIKSQS
jgi:hypothetical protein